MEFINLKAQYAALKKEIDLQIQSVLDSGRFIIGEKVEEFEHRLAGYIGVDYAVGCSDGTAALQLVYMAYDIGVGDAVFCPDMTFIATIEPACLLGATPVFCDIDMESYTLSPESLERQIQAVLREGKLRPRAIAAVDFVGNPADYASLRRMADRYGLLLIEDAAQSMGASWCGERCGSLGQVSVTSFFPSKPLGCYGDGGAVFTNDKTVAQKIISLREHGKGIDKYHNVSIGMNSRLDELQAAILMVKLSVLEEEIEKRQQIARIYDQALQSTYQIPVIANGNRSAYAQYVIMHKECGRREDIIAVLDRKKIPAILYYPTPMHMLPVFGGYQQYDETFEHTVCYAEESLGIPFSPYLTEEEQQTVIRALQSV